MNRREPLHRFPASAERALPFHSSSSSSFYAPKRRSDLRLEPSTKPATLQFLQHSLQFPECLPVRASLGFCAMNVNRFLLLCLSSGEFRNTCCGTNRVHSKNRCRVQRIMNILDSMQHLLYFPSRRAAPQFPWLL